MRLGFLGSATWEALSPPPPPPQKHSRWLRGAWLLVDTWHVGWTDTSPSTSLPGQWVYSGHEVTVTASPGHRHLLSGPLAPRGPLLLWRCRRRRHVPEGWRGEPPAPPLRWRRRRSCGGSWRMWRGWGSWRGSCRTRRRIWSPALQTRSRHCGSVRLAWMPICAASRPPLTPPSGGEGPLTPRTPTR